MDDLLGEVENQEVPQEGQADEEEKKVQNENLTEEMQEQIRDYFDYFDKAKQAKISFFDLTNLLRWLNFNPTATEIEGYKDQYDKTKEGLVTLADVLAICNKKIIEPDTIEELIEAMKILDVNNDGTILANELRWCLTQLGDPLELGQVTDLLKDLGVNEQQNYVDILEFAKRSFGEKKAKAA